MELFDSYVNRWAWQVCALQDILWLVRGHDIKVSIQMEARASLNLTSIELLSFQSLEVNIVLDEQCGVVH